MLRLASSTVGPLVAPPGTSVDTQTVEAFNLGDGALSLSVSSASSWITASLGSSRPCTNTTQARTCIPIQIALNIGSLANGTYTGIVRVTDPNAVDAPQTITVTVRIGAIDLYVAPETSRDVTFTTTSNVSTRTTTQDNGAWLTVALEGTGSFRFSYPYRVRLNAVNQGQGTYTGAVVVSGSPVATENRTIPVTMRVASQPIAAVSPDFLNVRLAQGAPAYVTDIALNNAGTGTLANLSATSNAAWLTAAALPSGARVTIDPGSLTSGAYTGSVDIGSNAVNGSVRVPVLLEIVSKGAPQIAYQGVRDNATFTAGDPVAQGGIAAVFGEQFFFSVGMSGPAPPLPTELAGTSVLVNGTPAPLYYSSYGQVNFQIPSETPVGTAQVQVKREGVVSNTVSVDVMARVPRLLRIGDYGAIVNATDGSLPYPTGSLGTFTTHPAKAGDTLTMYAIGLGPTSPSVPTGQPTPSDPLANTIETPVVTFGGGPFGVVVPAAFSGLSPGFAGLYQVNVTIPENVPRGTVLLYVSFSDSSSNSVQIVIQ